jgi:LDH2 family malate/lactate/ureidoglycolate dehydrogenase
VTDSETRISAESLITFARTAFERLGLGSADAKMGAEILIDANLMGLDTHGIAHIDSRTGPAVRIPSAPATRQCEPPVPSD